MEILPNDPVIVAAYRTPIGKYGGILSSIRPDDMLAKLLSETVKRAKINKDEIDEVLIGCANQAGEDNRNIARMSVLLAGLGESIPAITLNRLCASGLDAIIDAARRIITNEAEMVLAGGVESMSRAPYVMAKPGKPFQLGIPDGFDTSLGWRFFNENMLKITPPEHNGVTAERLATQYKISRTEQDEYALKSHIKACAAKDCGAFSEEIIPMSFTNRSELVECSQDEGPRRDTDLNKLSTLKPAFVENGSVTAGNSSSLNDGAALTVVTSHRYAKQNGLVPKARILGFASAGVDPKIMGIGPVPAIKKLLSRHNLAINDFSRIEINEAFAAQVIAVAQELELNYDLLNQRGGAIALGHPLGCSGARITTTLLNQLSSGDLGLVSLCVGVGQGVAMALQAL